jgi:hypothetical protein
VTVPIFFDRIEKKFLVNWKENNFFLFLRTVFHAQAVSEFPQKTLLLDKFLDANDFSHVLVNQSNQETHAQE